MTQRFSGIASGLIALASRLFPDLLPEGELTEFLGSAETRLSYPVNYSNGLGILVGLAFPLLLRGAIAHERALWRGLFLAAPAEQLAPPGVDEVYLHELEGFSVRLPDETPLGLVTAIYELPAGLVIEVQGPKREFLLPYKKEFVQQVDRAGRRLVVSPPEGLIEE